MKLTDTAIRNAKASNKPQKLTDGDGMHLLIHPNGSKYWRLSYRYAGKQKILALGVYPEVSLAEAPQCRAVKHQYKALSVGSRIYRIALMKLFSIGIA